MVSLRRFFTGRDDQISIDLAAGSLVLLAGAYRSLHFLFGERYPFSLGWSEGNRLWDYSIMFGRDLYNYPADQAIPVFLETNRQLVGAIPFLIPGVQIEHVRLWLALVDVVPYLVLGWIAFYLTKKGSLPAWMLAGVWAFTFVRQGPIHPPLLIRDPGPACRPVMTAFLDLCGWFFHE
jgi:hypothetical protein